MKHLKGMLLLAVILVSASMYPSLVNAEQNAGSTPIIGQSMNDTLVRTDEAGPFTLAHWRGRYRAGFYGRPHGRWYYGPRYRALRYYSTYPRCWWNGYRWVCPYRYRNWL